MVLTFPDGRSFATGATEFAFRPVSPIDRGVRLVVAVAIEGCPTSAILDTGSPYVICAPQLANLLNFDPDAALCVEPFLQRRIDTWLPSPPGSAECGQHIRR